MKSFIYSLLTLICVSSYAIAQPKSLSYYLPESNYNPDIPTPESILGYQVGEWHVSHDQLLYYAKAIAKASDRVEIKEYSRSHENRPLVLLTISSPENVANIESIRQNHLKLCDPNQNKDLSTDNMPVFIYQGYSVHGNEASGSNASLLVMYYLAAAQDAYIDNLLTNSVILLDPCYNPDGFQRFSSWVNSHKSKNMTGDRNHRELNEIWPRGRTNHYWFDLNRDWLLLTHPESQGRIKMFHHWKPDILTDHHEMGTNSTFFFQPGVPSRTNPNTPQENQDLTERIGEFHATALDSIGSLYYTKETFDDYYYGKGSTYPDANGAIGILFEQASSRGHLSESVNGPLSFPFTIRNQVTTSLSTQKAGLGLRKQLLDYKKKFFQNAIEEANANRIKAYIFSEPNDPAKINAFLSILLAHQIEVYRLDQNINDNGVSYHETNSYVVPLKQSQYKLAKTIFEKVNSFRDSLFYDVSAWTMPLAFNIPYTELSDKQFKRSLLGEALIKIPVQTGKLLGAPNDYAFIIPWEQYFAPKALYQLLAKGLKAKVLHNDFEVKTAEGYKIFRKGAILLSNSNQTLDKSNLYKLLEEIVNETAIEVYGIQTGLTKNGNAVGSPSGINISKPEILLFSGTGTGGYEVGEIWHVFDQRFDIPITMADLNRFNQMSLNRYNVIIMADGSYSSLKENGAQKLKDWVEGGGTLIAQRGAIQWLNIQKLINVESKKAGDSPEKSGVYNQIRRESGALVTGGTIVSANMDLTHPLCYGYSRNKIALFRKGNYFLEIPSNEVSAPIKYSSNPLMSGYMAKRNQKMAANSSAVIAAGKGQGKIIAFLDDLNFRGYWYGGTKIFMNAVFFAPSIRSDALSYD